MSLGFIEWLSSQLESPMALDSARAVPSTKRKRPPSVPTQSVPSLSSTRLRTLLVAIARHKIEDIYRQRLRTALVLDLDSTEDEPASNDTPLDEQIDKARAGAKTRRVLERMPERYALILLWRYWEQRSARDVAAATATTEKSVERLLARARAKFKELWLKE